MSEATVSSLSQVMLPSSIQQHDSCNSGIGNQDLVNSARHRDLTNNVYLIRKSSYMVFKTASLVTYALDIGLAKNFVSVIPYNVVEKIKQTY